MFPKIIHQIWYQGIENMPTQLKENTKLIQQKHPNFKYFFWDKQKIDYLIEKDKNLIATFKKFSHMHQYIDFAKYIILFLYGGIYIDMDVTIIKNFDELLNEYNSYECLLSSTYFNTFENIIFCQYKICINNGIIISKPKCDFLLAIIKQIISDPSCKHSDFNKSICINRTTGPLLVTNVYKKYPFKQKIKILHWSYLEPCIFKNLCNVESNTVAVHYHDATWINKNLVNLAYFYFKYKNIAIFIALVLIFILFFVIFKFVKYLINK